MSISAGDAAAAGTDSRQHDAMGLAAILLDDAINAARDSDDFGLYLDVAVCLIEWERAGGADRRPEEFFGNAAQIVKDRPDIGPWLYNGVAHLGWSALLMNRTGKLRFKNTGWIDEYLMYWVESYPETLDIDLPQGVIGLGVYGLAHPSASIKEALSRGVLNVIRERQDTDCQYAFVRRADPCREQMRPEYVIGHRDLGVAHGNMGVAAYLAAVAMSGQRCAEQAQEMLRPIARWLLRMAVPDEDGVFGTTAERRWQATRSAWCYGDPGSSTALGLIAAAVDDKSLADACKRMAERAALVSLGRPADRAGVVDACLCHGAAGLCYFGRRWHGLFCLQSLGYAFQWLSYIQKQRAQGRLLYHRHPGLVHEGSFLEGDCGVAAALIYLATGLRPLWENRLLMSGGEGLTRRGRGLSGSLVWPVADSQVRGECIDGYPAYRTV